MGHFNTLHGKNEFLVTLAYACDSIYNLERYFNSKNYDGIGIDSQEVIDRIERCADLMRELDRMHADVVGWEDL